MGSKLEGPEREWNVGGKDLDGKVNAREGSGEEWVGDNQAPPQKPSDAGSSTLSAHLSG